MARWETCRAAGCEGAVLSDGACLAHLERSKRHAALSAAGSNGLDARGVRFDEALLADLLESLPRGDDGSAAVGKALFGCATFEPPADFSAIDFRDGASFKGARFMREVRFAGGQSLSFAEAAFAADVSFDGADFYPWDPGPGRPLQKGTGTEVSFRGAVFAGRISFDRARFGVEARFDGATFAGPVSFDATLFAWEARFDGAIFEQAQRIGPLIALDPFVLSEASFERAVQILVAGGQIACGGTRFLGGVTLRARRCDVALDGAELAEPSTIVSELRQFETRDGSELDEAEVEAQAAPDRGVRARIVSLRGANLGGALFSNVDLSACQFVGAHGLDRLGLNNVTFAHPPAGWRWTGRRVLAEEHRSRAVMLGQAGWWPLTIQPPDWLSRRVWRGRDFEPPSDLDPTQVASIYRALRKGREDTGDAPGAADFYYGEMEMRRLSPPPSDAALGERLTQWGEHAIVWLYWLTAGYGLRASRALLALVITVFVFAAVLDRWGIARESDFGDALLYSVQSTTSLFSGPQRELSTAGEVSWIALRLLGPLFFGFMLLCLRGRIKR